MSKRKEVTISPSDLEFANEKAQEIREINEEEFKKTGKKKKYLIKTYGCQMNSLRCIFISRLSSLSINKSMCNAIYKFN